MDSLSHPIKTYFFTYSVPPKEPKEFKPNFIWVDGVLCEVPSYTGPIGHVNFAKK